jgi:catechol 2,3-dioxygenase-like lactoylglutathione lyase family enzyme
MKIKLTSLYVEDVEKAQRFYTGILGFVKKADVTQGAYRWVTVVSAEEPEGVELHLAPNDSPAARAYQQAMFGQNQPAAIFHTTDLQGDCTRLAAAGVTFRVPLTTHAWGSMAMLDDTCGNLIQLTQPAW